VALSQFSHHSRVLGFLEVHHHRHLSLLVQYLGLQRSLVMVYLDVAAMSLPSQLVEHLEVAAVPSLCLGLAQHRQPLRHRRLQLVAAQDYLVLLHLFSLVQEAVVLLP
jgi:hypothetical protein